jgi:hypothetical protein
MRFETYPDAGGESVGVFGQAATRLRVHGSRSTRRATPTVRVFVLLCPHSQRARAGTLPGNRPAWFGARVPCARSRACAGTACAIAFVPALGSDA